MCDENCIIWGLENISVDEIMSKRILEVGSLDVNGTLRYGIQRMKPSEYIGVDIEEGRGVDLPYDSARWCIVCKVPFPDLSDKQVSARLYSGGSFGRQWYAQATASTLMQMTGRIVRAMDDYGTSWILDRQFENFYSKHSGLFYNWWTEALEFNV